MLHLAVHRKIPASASRAPGATRCGFSTDPCHVQRWASQRSGELRTCEQRGAQGLTCALLRTQSRRRCRRVHTDREREREGTFNSLGAFCLLLVTHKGWWLRRDPQCKLAAAHYPTRMIKIIDRAWMDGLCKQNLAPLSLHYQAQGGSGQWSVRGDCMLHFTLSRLRSLP
jgi:hypothetical protein